MRIVQMIDSLQAGGAEKMAINYANALVNKIEFSGLIATREEGDLKVQIDSKVNYSFLDKKKTIDFKAAIRLKKYCKINNVEVIHAHSSSYFIGFMAKLIYPKVKLIWHDHNGFLQLITKTTTYALKISSYFFSGIIAVNYELKNWSEKKLYCKNIIYFPNFTSLETASHTETFLKGIAGKRILCLANLRPQKNHFLVLTVAEKIRDQFPEWTFHLIGKDFEDDYSMQIKNRIEEMKLQESVFVYGSKSDTTHIINQCEIAILTSNSEGLPVSLIEYGLSKKAVVCTKVGEIPLIINHGHSGFIVEINDAEMFSNYLIKLINDKDLRNNLGAALFETVTENNSQEAIIGQYLNWLNKYNGN